MSRRPGARFNRGRIATVAAPPALVGAQGFDVEIVASKLDPLAADTGFAVNIVAGLDGGFSPEDVAGGVVWIDMQDPSAYTAGANVSAVVNKFSSVSWTEATSQPTFSATGINGYPCMDFNGVGNKILHAEAAVLAASANQLDYYVAMIVDADDLDAVEVIFGTGISTHASAGSKRWGTNTTGAGRWTAIGTNDAAVGTVADTAGSTVSDPVLFEAYSETQVTGIRINGAAVNMAAGGAVGTPTAYGALTSDRGAIGCKPSSTLVSFFDGRVGEILQYGLISEPDKALIRAYLIDKWDIV